MLKEYLSLAIEGLQRACIDAGVNEKEYQELNAMIIRLKEMKKNVK